MAEDVESGVDLVDGPETLALADLHDSARDQVAELFGRARQAEEAFAAAAAERDALQRELARVRGELVTTKGVLELTVGRLKDARTALIELSNSAKNNAKVAAFHADDLAGVIGQ